MLCIQPQTSRETACHDKVRPRPARPPGGGPAPAERRRAATPTTSCCPACCTASCCAARTPRRRSAPIDTDSRSIGCPGCSAIYTAADLNADGIGAAALRRAGAEPRRHRTWRARRIRCWPTARCAMSAIRSPSSSPTPSKQARDAAEADRGRLRRPALDHRPRRRRWTRARRWSGPMCSDNIVFDWEIGDKAATDALFAKAAHVTQADGGEQPHRRRLDGGARRAWPITTPPPAAGRCTPTPRAAGW